MSLELCPTCENLVCSCSDAPTVEPEYILPDSFKYNTILPQKTRVCELCDATGDWFKHSGMFMCPPCRDAEIAAHLKNMVGADKRVADSTTDMLARQNKDVIEKRTVEIEQVIKDVSVDTGVAVRADIFNANTVSIVDLKIAIDTDPLVTKKNYALAAALKDRFLHLRRTLFDIAEAQVSITSEQKSIQVYLNDLSVKLRTEEREKLKIADLSYTPVAPKLVKATVKKPKTPKFDKNELERISKEINVPTYTIQAMCVSMNKTPLEIGEMLSGLQTKGE